MTDTEKISQQLGSDMVAVDMKLLSQSDLPISTKDWLATVGIPKTVQLPFGLVLKGVFALNPVPSKPQSGLIIGETDGPSYMAIKPDGTVVMSCETDEPDTFVNPSIGQFFESLTIYAEYVKRKMDRRQFETRLMQLDPEATRSEEQFWALVLEDAGYFDFDE